MGKKYVISIVVGVSVGGLLTALYLWRVKSSGIQNNPDVDIASPTKIPQAAMERATWKDQAGISFQYPKELTTNKHDEDQDNYAHIEFTHKDHPGSVIVWVKDVPAKVYDAAGWVKSERKFVDAPVFDATLAGKIAKRILVTTPKKMIVIGTMSDDLLYYIEASLEDSEYWTNVSDTISKTFTITPQEISTASSAGADVGTGDEPVDEEEVVE